MTGMCDSLESGAAVPVASTLQADRRESWPARPASVPISSSIRGLFPLRNAFRNRFALFTMSDRFSDPFSSGAERNVTSASGRLPMIVTRIGIASHRQSCCGIWRCRAVTAKLHSL
jgi:hypothetical protein